MDTTINLAPLPPMPKSKTGARAKVNDCECGCGGKTGTRFVPGHDSRLRGWMLRLERGLIAPKVGEAGITKGELEAALAHLKADGKKIPEAKASK